MRPNTHNMHASGTADPAPWDRGNSNRNLTDRTLPKPRLKIKAAALVFALCYSTFAYGQAHRNLPNAVLVEPQKFPEERAVLRWEVRPGAEAVLITAYDMDGRKKWSLRTSEGRYVLKRETQAFEVLIVPVQKGARAPDWVALDDPNKSSSSPAVAALPATALPPVQKPVAHAAKPSPIPTDAFERSQPASIFLGPTPTPKKPEATPTPHPSPTPVATPAIATPTPTPAPTTPPPTPVSTQAANEETKPLRGGMFALLGGAGKSLLSMTRSDFDVTMSASDQTAAAGMYLPLGTWGMQSFWFQGYRFSQETEWQASGRKGTTDISFTGAFGDISFALNFAGLTPFAERVFAGAGPLIASSQSPGLPSDYVQTPGVLPSVEKVGRVGGGGTAILGWRADKFSILTQGCYVQDGGDAGQTLIGRMVLSQRLAGPFSAMLGVSMEELRLSLCRGSEDYCRDTGNTRIRLTEANGLLGLGATW